MIRYRLDELGWSQFEELIQSLLKAELGIGVESWGRRGDHGIDAYSPGPLNFPSRHLTSDGPFIFQIKFVEGANAAGAKPSKPLMTAVTKEAARIQKRIETQDWQALEHYTLVTNAPLSADLRGHITESVREVLPDTHIHNLGGDDVCDLLENQRALVRSFPQLLGLRDIESLIREASGAEILEKSRSTIAEARELLCVFTPTAAYDRAWVTLRKYHFAVLEGPAEMGKTSIALMVALAQASNKWKAVTCDGPDEFFKCYDSSSMQVFVADDAFGRTEYDATRGSRWEAQLHRVHRQLDPKHWLVWTSRRNVLERARRLLDLQGNAADFPEPGAVLVDASSLTVREKALILYRHAKAAGLEPEARDLVRRHASLIVYEPSFTPETIRRFVEERLPELARLGGTLGPDRVIEEIREAIRNPTERMRKSFEALPLSLKWALIALLEADPPAITSRVGELYEALCPTESRRPFAEVFDELSESFVKVIPPTQEGEPNQIHWIHPSYRDLVIDELVKDAGLRFAFLESMSPEGVKLAISGSGGGSGERELPLMKSSESWKLLKQRSLALVTEAASSPWDAMAILRALISAAWHASNEPVKAELLETLAEVCEALRQRWNDEQTPLGAYHLDAYIDATELLRPLPRLPDLTPSWQKAESELSDFLSAAETQGFIQDGEPFSDCVSCGHKSERMSRDIYGKWAFRQSTWAR